jgi:hypothetical protein
MSQPPPSTPRTLVLTLIRVAWTNLSRDRVAQAGDDVTPERLAIRGSLEAETMIVTRQVRAHVAGEEVDIIAMGVQREAVVRARRGIEL